MGSFLAQSNLKPCRCEGYFSLWRKWPFLGRKRGRGEGERGTECSIFVKWLLGNRKQCEGYLSSCYFSSWVLATQYFPLKNILRCWPLVVIWDLSLGSFHKKTQCPRVIAFCWPKFFKGISIRKHTFFTSSTDNQIVLLLPLKAAFQPVWNWYITGNGCNDFPQWRVVLAQCWGSCSFNTYINQCRISACNLETGKCPEIWGIEASEMQTACLWRDIWDTEFSGNGAAGSVGGGGEEGGGKERKNNIKTRILSPRVDPIPDPIPSASEGPADT